MTAFDFAQSSALSLLLDESTFLAAPMPFQAPLFCAYNFSSLAFRANNLQNGFGRLCLSNGDVYEGNFRDGRMDGCTLRVLARLNDVADEENTVTTKTIQIFKLLSFFKAHQVFFSSQLCWHMIFSIQLCWHMINVINA